MPARIPDDERARIIELCQQGLSARAIARETGRSTSSISTIAAEFGHRFGQANIAHARAVRKAYDAEARAEIAALAAQRARDLLEDFDEAQPVVDRDGVVSEVGLDARGQKDRAQAANLLSRTALDIDRHDRRDDEGLAAVDAWLRDVMGTG